MPSPYEVHAPHYGKFWIRHCAIITIFSLIVAPSTLTNFGGVAVLKNIQRALFLSEFNDRGTIAPIEANKDIYFLQKRIEKFPLKWQILISILKENSINTV